MDVRPQAPLNIKVGLSTITVKKNEERKQNDGPQNVGPWKVKKKKKKTGDQQARNLRRLQKKADKAETDSSPAFQQCFQLHYLVLP